MTSVTLIWQCPLLTVVLYIFCLPCAVHFCSYKEKFISLYCRLSSVLDLDSLITQQAFREAITDSELSTAKQRHQHIMDYIQVWSGKGNVICNFVQNYTINKKRFLFINYCDEWGGAESRGNGARPVEWMIMNDTCATHRSRVPRRSSGRNKRRSDDIGRRERTRPGF